MGKFLWNAACLVLVAINIFSMFYCLVEQTAFSGVMLLGVAVLDMAYAEKRPTYIKF